ncbi:MAG: hypothetical protein P8175_17110 [Deltaproteobacteria bacterium]
MTENPEKESESLIIGQVQLILAEKRTSLAAMRTGIAVFALPLSVLSVLVATSQYYNFMHVIHLIIPLFILSAAMIFLGSYLIIRSILRIRHQDRMILEIKGRSGRIAGFIS